jgi:nucleotide-binding universal stress UspA family protein
VPWGFPDGGGPSARDAPLTSGHEPSEDLEEGFVKTILIATDGSDAAHEALAVAIDIARDTGATLQILSVRPAIGSRGLGSLSGAVLGSVSRALVQRSSVPITIVRHGSVHAATES